MSLIGIDPGSSGGIAWTDSDGEFHAVKMPETVGDLVDTLRTLRVEGCHTAWCEKVHAMPGQGVTSMFTFGRGLGNIEAACQALGIRLEWVTPQKWQLALGCRTAGDKNVSKNKAQELFPATKVTHAIADSLLICEYGHRQGNGGASGTR
jgi:crossover junction endodeoxyribonuclease RuvC